MIGAILWQLLHEDWIKGLKTDGSAGPDFEDKILQHVYLAVSKLGGYQASPPRTTPRLKTVSGLPHQIDVVVKQGISTYHLIECKFTKTANIEELFAFNAKLLDYAFGALRAKQNLVFRGYFVTGLTGVNDHFYQYAISWGITPIIVNGLPPLEFMECKTSKDSELHDQILKLQKATGVTDIKGIAYQSQSAKQLVDQWQLIYHRWKQEGCND